MSRALLAGGAALLGALAAAATPRAAEDVNVATFAGGCFWCEEAAFQDTPGVTSVVSGYTGGTKADPSYEQVSAGGTGHAESVEVRYDPARISYAQLLDIFWHNTDPLDGGGQFCDRGNQYRSEIFYHGDEQKRLAEDSLARLKESGRFDKPIATTIAAAGPFYPAEDYHQEYYQKNPVRYHYYKWACGREQRLEQLWGPKTASAS